MSLSINYSSGIGLHGVDPISVSKDLIEWISSYSDITVTGKTNFKNDINLLYDELNYLNISIDQYSNTTLDITGNGQNGTLIINNRINANNGLVITGDTVIGEDSTDLMTVNSNAKFSNDVDVGKDLVVSKTISAKNVNEDIRNKAYTLNNRIDTHNDSWTQLGQDLVGDTGDYSGRSVSLSADGTIVAIGDNGHDATSSNQGRTRIYQYSSNTWSQLGQDLVGDTGDHSGISVSLSADGSIVAIGANGYDATTYSNQGRTRIWKYRTVSQSEWESGSIFIATAGQTGVGDNDTSVNSSRGEAYSSTTKYWIQLGDDLVGESDDQSGISVSLSADGTIIAIGAYQALNSTNEGRTRIYQYSSNTGTWTQLGQDLVGDASDYSGRSVSLSTDGTIVAIGAYYDGNGGRTRIYQYSSNTDTWIQLGVDIIGNADDNSGHSVSLSADGTIVAIGASYYDSYKGRTRIYQYSSSSNTWIQLGQDLVGDTGMVFSGTSVSLSADGTIVAIGANWYNDGTGKTRIYQYSSNTWIQLGQDLVGDSDSRSGESVSLSADGTIVSIGAYTHHVNVDNIDDNNGKTRIYHLSEYFKSNVHVNGYVGIGTTSPEALLHISSGTTGSCELILEADTDNNNESDNARILFRQDGGYIWSMIGASPSTDNELILANSAGLNSGGIVFKTANTYTSGVDRAYENATEVMRIHSNQNVGIGTDNPTEKLEVNGNMKVNGDLNCNSNILSHNFIYKNITGYENLYYWEGSNVLISSTTSITEPYGYYNSGYFYRLTKHNSAVIDEYYHTRLWNGSYMFRAHTLTIDSRPPSNAFSSSYNYLKLTMPVKPGVSNSFFIRGIGGDRWQSYVVYVNNENNNGSYGYYRLEARTNVADSNDRYNTSSWFGPNGEGSINSEGYHDWVMFYIPQYIIDEYSYTTTDIKSKYRKNINIYIILGANSDASQLYISGFAMRENPLDIVITNAKVLHLYLNGGNTGLNWNNDNYNHEGLIEIHANKDNILIPIPNKKNPSIYGYPNFILGCVEHTNYNTFHGMRAEINMQSNINSSTLKNLGKFTRYNVGVFGLFLKERHKHPIGLIVPKLPYNSEFITIYQGRPYLRIKYTKNPDISYTRGFYTELLDYTDNHANMNIDGYQPVTYP